MKIGIDLGGSHIAIGVVDKDGKILDKREKKLRGIANRLIKKTIEETIENAKKQIEERKYEEDLQERGYTNITKMVFAFKGKEVKMQVI